jgi:hypothetical protein
MALMVESLPPSYGLTGVASTYGIRFTDDITGLPVIPTSVDSLRVFDPSNVEVATYLPPDILNPAAGQYTVADVARTVAGDYKLRWTYTVGVTAFSFTVSFQYNTTSDTPAVQRVKDYIKAKLGAGVLFVELPDGSLDFALEEATLWFATWKGQPKEVTINVLPNQIDYQVPSDCYYVFKVALPDDLYRAEEFLGAFGVFGMSQLGIGAVPVEDLYGGGMAQSPYSSLIQSMQHAEVGRRVLGAEPEWEWNAATRTVRLLPRPRRPATMLVSYISNVIDFSNMLPSDMMFVREYALACAKETLGRIRNKFGGYPTAEGERTLDGDTLLAEAAEAKRELTERLMDHAYPGGFMVG